jgi:hypothetical protein
MNNFVPAIQWIQMWESVYVYRTHMPVRCETQG